MSSRRDTLDSEVNPQNITVVLVQSLLEKEEEFVGEEGRGSQF